jgi:UBX domain-containing protein 1
MPNIHGLSSIRNDGNNNNNNDSDSDDENNRYVGGVSSRGGGSGLAVMPNNTNDSSSSGNAASDSIFNLAESGSGSAESGGGGGGRGEVRRMITMYRSGFTVDNGPYRRLDDPSNAEFLGSLARGLIPRELREDAEGGAGGEVMVGLVDKRGEEYDADRHGQRNGSGGSGGAPGFQSFSGEGQSLVDSSSATAAAAPSGGVIDPNTVAAPPPLDDSKPSTSIAIRLLNGKRLVVKINLESPVSELGQHIGSQAGGDSYVLTSGYPPAVIDDLSKSVEEAGLKGAQVVLKKA